MDKEHLLGEIEGLPKFEKVDVWANRDRGLVRQERFRGIAEVGKNDVIAFVYRDYRLVQFQEVFKPIVERLENIEGEVHTYMGKAILEIFPKDEDLGVAVLNSVDKSWALKVNFVQRLGQGMIVIPRDVYGYRKVHRGEVLQSYEGFTYTLTEVRKAWKTIVEKMSKAIVDDERLLELKEALKLGKRLNQSIDAFYAFREKVSLWEFFVECIKLVSARRYKSPIHLRERLARISRTIVSYAIALELA